MQILAVAALAIRSSQKRKHRGKACDKALVRSPMLAVAFTVLYAVLANYINSERVFQKHV